MVRHPGVFKGYFKNEEATKEVIDSDGWLYTGDVGEFDGEFLKIVDRKKDIIITKGGKNVSPSEIENNIHMTNNQSRQDPLNYGIRINNRIAFLLADSQRGDYPPTDQSKEFFIQVKGELDSEVMKLDALIDMHSQKIENYLS